MVNHLLAVPRTREYLLLVLCIIIFSAIFLVMLFNESPAIFLSPMFSFLLVLALLCDTVWRSANNMYIFMAPFLQVKMITYAKFISFGILFWMSLLISIANFGLLGLIGVHWLCICVIYYVFQKKLNSYMIPICLLSGMLSLIFCSWLVVNSELTSQKFNSILIYCISVGLSFLLLSRTKKIIEPESSINGLSCWLNNLYPRYRNGKSVVSGFYTPSWVIKLYFPHSFMVSGMLFSNMFNTMIAVSLVGFSSLFLENGMSLKWVCFWFVFYTGLVAGSFDRAAKMSISVVDFQTLSLMPLFKHRIDLIHKLLLSFVAYIVLYTVFSLFFFSLAHGEVPKFSLLQWSICILAPLSIGSVSCLVISTLKRLQKFALLSFHVTGYVVLTFVVHVYFSSFVDFLLVTIYLVAQTSANFYFGRKKLIERDWS